jgi:hypothetical protein
MNTIGRGGDESVIVRSRKWHGGLAYSGVSAVPTAACFIRVVADTAVSIRLQLCSATRDRENSEAWTAEHAVHSNSIPILRTSTAPLSRDATKERHGAESQKFKKQHIGTGFMDSKMRLGVKGQ